MQINIGQPELRGPQRLAIVTASDAEAAYVRRWLDVEGRRTQSPGALWQGRCRAHEIVLLRCGIGPERAAASLHWLCGHSRLRGVLSVGFAGGLQQQLATGDAVWVTHISAVEDSAMRQVPNLVPDRGLTTLLAAAARRAGLVQHRGALLSSAELVPQAATKRAFGERSGAVAIDMESYSLGRVAAHYHLPFASMRTIFDTCLDHLPFPVDSCTDPDGRLPYSRLAAYMARHPRTLLALPHLRAQARLAGQHLGIWLDHFFGVLDQQASCWRPRRHASLFHRDEVDIEPEAGEL